MKKVQISSDELRGRLFAVHPNSGMSSPFELPPPADPTFEATIQVEIAKIKPYDRNPRRERNPKYDEIKENIRTRRGLNNPFTITRRPGDEHYMVESGGNTRLQILHELHAETGDAVYAKIAVVFRPWVSESHLLINHLVENELRGEMVFIDKALAIDALKKDIEAERGATLSRRDFIEFAKERGVPVSTGQYQRMTYAVSTLYPLIPQALSAGIGPRQIEAIGALESTYRDYWIAREAGSAEAYAELFADTLRKFDSFEFVLEAVQDSIEDEISSLLGCPVSHIKLEVDAMKHGIALPDESVNPPSAGPVVTSGHNADTRASQATPISRGGTTRHVSRSEASSPKDAGEGNDARDPTPDLPAELHRLRAANHHVALRLARDWNLGDCLHPAPDLGVGYFIDIPRRPLMLNSFEGRMGQLVWWTLFGMSVEHVAPERFSHFSNSEVYQLWRAGETGKRELWARVGRDPGIAALYYDMLFNAVGDVDDRIFNAYVELLQNCRRLHKLVNCDGGLALWESTERNMRPQSPAQ